MKYKYIGDHLYRFLKEHFKGKLDSYYGDAGECPQYYLMLGIITETERTGFWKFLGPETHRRAVARVWPDSVDLFDTSWMEEFEEAIRAYEKKFKNDVTIIVGEKY